MPLSYVLVFSLSRIILLWLLWVQNGNSAVLGSTEGCARIQPVNNNPLLTPHSPADRFPHCSYTPRRDSSVLFPFHPRLDSYLSTNIIPKMLSNGKTPRSGVLEMIVSITTIPA